MRIVEDVQQKGASDVKLREKLYLVFTAVSIVMAAFTVISSMQGTAGTSESAFAWGDGTVMVAVCALFALVQVICLFTFRPKLQFRTLGFYLLHIGLLLVLLGCFLYYNAGTDADGDGMQDNLKYVQVVPSDQIYAEYSTLGFGIGISDAGVTYYEDGTPKYYYADLVLESGTSSDTRQVTLSVNHPCHENGWKIYLMNYEQATDQVTLLFKQDPGEYWTVTGICMVILGTFLMCLVRRRPAPDLTAVRPSAGKGKAGDAI